MGYIGIGSGLGAFAASVVTRRKHLQVAENHLDELTKQHRAEVDLQNELLISRDDKILALKADNSKRFKRIQDLDLELK